MSPPISGNIIPVNTYTTNDQSRPSVGVLSDGGWLIVWASYGQDGFLEGVYGQRYNSDGTSAGSEFRVNNGVESSQSYPSVAGLANGGWVVFWQNNYTGLGATAFSITGMASGNDFGIPLDNYNTSSVSDPHIVALIDGGYVVVWQGWAGTGDTYYGVYGQRYTSTGVTSGSVFRANTYKTGLQSDPSVTALSDGGWLVVWNSYGQVPDRLSWYDVYGQRFSSTGVAVGSEFLVNTHFFDSAEPSVGSLTDGGWIVVWTKSDGAIYGQLSCPL